MAFQDEAAEVFESLAKRIGDAGDQEVAGAQLLIDVITNAEGDEAARIRSTMHEAGDHMAAIARELLVDLGHRDLLGDDNAMVFLAIAALSSVLGVQPVGDA